MARRLSTEQEAILGLGQAMARDPRILAARNQYNSGHEYVPHLTHALVLAAVWSIPISKGEPICITSWDPRVSRRFQSYEIPNPDPFNKTSAAAAGRDLNAAKASATRAMTRLELRGLLKRFDWGQFDLTPLGLETPVTSRSWDGLLDPLLQALPPYDKYLFKSVSRLLRVVHSSSLSK